MKKATIFTLFLMLLCCSISAQPSRKSNSNRLTIKEIVNSQLREPN